MPRVVDIVSKFKPNDSGAKRIGAGTLVLGQVDSRLARVLVGGGITPDLPDALQGLRNRTNTIVARVTQALGDTFQCSPTTPPTSPPPTDIIADDDTSLSGTNQVSSMSAICEQVDRRLGQVLVGGGITPDLPDPLRAMRTAANVISVRVTNFLGDGFPCTPTDLPTYPDA